MGSTFYGLEIAKSGLRVSQSEMNVSSHNIANVDTEGFTRQRIYTSSVAGSGNHVQFAVDKSGLAGRGVTAVTVEQIRSPFLDYQYRKENASTTKWATKEQYFYYVEDLFNNELNNSVTVSSSISSQLGDFYDSLYKLVESPADIEIRANVQQNALKLTETMNYYFDQLIDQQSTLNENVKVTVNQINQYSEQIAELNKQIMGYELSGDKANDLRDKRNAMLDELSGLIDITYSEDSSGYLNVQIDGNYLVRQSSSNQLAVAATMDNPIRPGAENRLYEVYWADNTGAAVATKKIDADNGALSAFMEIRDGNTKYDIGIPYIVGQLNELCQKIVKDVNTVHKTGYTTPNDSNGNVSQNGINFFADTSVAQDGSEVTAENFALSTDVMQNVYNIAASDTAVVAGGENEQRGNGKIALKLAELINSTDASGNPNNFDSVYKTIVTGVGIEMSNISSTTEIQSITQEHLTEQRKSISDVSLDEEMTNIIKFSHAYSAASRMITAMDKQLDVLINQTGLVGRG